MSSKAEDCRPLRGVDRVFEAARELFYRNGVRATGVDQIVAEAGVTKPTLYRAFESKDELLAACLRDYVRQSREWWDEAVAPYADDPRGAILAILRTFSEKACGLDDRGCPLTNVAIEFPEASARALITECKQDVRDRLVAYARPLAGARAPLLADSLVLLIEGAMASRQVFGPAGPSRQIVEAGETLLDAYADPKPDRG